MIFRSGIYTALFCFILWIVFDLLFLSKVKGIRAINEWILSSYRKSIVMTITIGFGYFTIISKILDLMNCLIGTILLLGLIACYNILVVSKNKTLKVVK